MLPEYPKTWDSDRSVISEPTDTHTWIFDHHGTGHFGGNYYRCVRCNLESGCLYVSHPVEVREALRIYEGKECDNRPQHERT